VASFDGPSAFLATLLILHFCCVLVKCFCYMENKLSLSLSTVDGSASVVSECNTTCIVVVVVLVTQWNLQELCR